MKKQKGEEEQQRRGTDGFCSSKARHMLHPGHAAIIQERSNDVGLGRA
jgi:hypothetical protein